MGDQNADAGLRRGGIVADDGQIFDARIEQFANDAVRRSAAHEAAEQDAHPVLEARAQISKAAALAGDAHV